MAHSDLVERVGTAVADGVLALSKDTRIPKSETMADSLERIRKQPFSVWCGKLAVELLIFKNHRVTGLLENVWHIALKPSKSLMLLVLPISA